MYALVIVIHCIACLILIASILLQAGRGGGLAGMFGAGSSQTIFGARASTFLTRVTTVAAVAFLLTCLSLTVLSSSRFKSLMTGVEQAGVTQGPLPEPVQEVTSESANQEGLPETGTEPGTQEEPFAEEAIHPVPEASSE